MFFDWFYTLLRGIVWLFLRTFLGFKVTGIEKIPKRGGLILAANHTSYLDIPCVATASPRRVYFIAREDLSDNWLLKVFMRAFDTIPVARGEADFAAIRSALRELEKEKVVCIFPEGTRSADGILSKATGVGAGFLAVKAGVPVVPIYIDGTFQVLPKGARGLRLHPVKIDIGEPIDPKKIHPETPMKERYEKLTQQVMRSLKHLQEKGGC